MRQLNAKILENNKVASGFYRMRLESTYLGKNTKPGQFVEVRCSDETDPLLRRPFSCHRISKGGIELLYEVVGKATEALSKKKAGEMLDVIGPLGNGFKIDHRPKTKDQRPSILVAGGMGVAPLLALAEELVSRRSYLVSRKKERLHVLMGACTKEHILCEDEFKKLGTDVLVATEDGSKGYKGLVTDPLKVLLRDTRYESRVTIYACGPAGMLKAVAKIASAGGVPCQVSLEERMACGVGVCLGCPVKIKTRYEIRDTRYEYKMVCKDGPVFSAKEIAW